MTIEGGMMKKIINISIIILSCSILFACGYSFISRGESIDKNIQKVYVKQFDNRTAQADIDNYIRTAFINQFIQNSRFKMVNSVEGADAIVKGKIINHHTSPLSHLKNDLAAEERTSITIEVAFQDNSNGKVIWSANNMTETVDYKLNEDINLLTAIRKQALIKLSNDIAEKSFNLMMSGF